MKIQIKQDTAPRKYEPLPVGRQALRFTAVDHTTSKAGNPMYVWKLDGLDNRGDVIHYLTVSEKTQFAWIAAVNAAFPDTQIEEIDVDDVNAIKEMFLGRVVDGDIVHTEWSGKTQVKIQRMMAHASAKYSHEAADKYWNRTVFNRKASSAPVGTATFDDDIPF